MKNCSSLLCMLGFSLVLTTSCNNENQTAQNDSTTNVDLVSENSLIYPNEIYFKSLNQYTNNGDNAEAYWSFDNSQLVFQAKNEAWGADCDQIYFFTPGIDQPMESVPQRVSTGKGRTTCSYFMPGDSTIIYASTHLADENCPPEPDRSSGKYVWPIYDSFEIFVADKKGNILQQLTNSPGYDAEATVSPKGDKIVFTSVRDGDLDLYTMNIDGSDVKRITNSLGYDGGAFFSPDGTKLIFRASRPQTEEEINNYKELLSQNLVEPTSMELFVCNTDGSEMRQITNLGKANWCPFFHPSGEKVIFSSNHQSERGFPFNLYMINLDGTGLEQITFDEAFDAFPMFSPDGHKLAFSSNRNNGGTRSTNLFIAEWQEPEGVSSSELSWLGKFGLFGFLFFLIKGLVWLAIFLGAGKLFKKYLKRNNSEVVESS